ncbi:MAG: hypothetical protein H0V03_11160 [Thermoleophilaceae bacterium]|nr:hypothetical protein [Thermoleophilaceae bacterium]
MLIMRMNSHHRRAATVMSVAALAVTAAACGGDEAAQPAQAPPEKAKPVAQIDQLSGRSTAVKLDSGFVEALTSLKVTPGPVGDAKITKGGSAVFPITGGDVTYYEPGSVDPYVQGTIMHEDSGLSLEAGGKTVELTDFVVDPGASVLTGTVSVDGEVAAEKAPIFNLDGRTLKPLQANDNGTAVLEGTKVKLTQVAAGVLNETFGVDAIKGGLDIGVAKITVNTK